jgi:Signal transduction histidine kinase
MPVRAGTRALEALIDALISNALQHTPRTAAIAVAASVDRGWVEFTIDDAGPGFPSGAVLERGVRGRESEGTGLGLDIARRTAVAAGGTLSIAGSPLGGARVLIRLPLVVGAVG